MHFRFNFPLLKRAWFQFFPLDINCVSNGIGEDTDAGNFCEKQFSRSHPMASLRICEQVCGQTDIPGTVAHITRNAGFGGLFKGLGITATREVPAFAVYFSSYEVIVRLAPIGIQQLEFDNWLSGSLVRARLLFSLVEGWQEFFPGCSRIHKTSSSRDFKRTTLVVRRSTGDPCIVFRHVG